MYIFLAHQMQQEVTGTLSFNSSPSVSTKRDYQKTPSDPYIQRFISHFYLNILQVTPLNS